MPAETWPIEAHTVTLDGPETPALSRTGLVLDENGLRITAIEVNHEPIRPAYAYRFDFKGRSVVVSGDLKHHPPLAEGARGADILVIEGISTTIPLHRKLIQEPRFLAGKVHTRFVEEWLHEDVLAPATV